MWEREAGAASVSPSTSILLQSGELVGIESLPKVYSLANRGFSQVITAHSSGFPRGEHVDPSLLSLKHHTAQKDGDYSPWTKEEVEEQKRTGVVNWGRRVSLSWFF